MRRIYKKLIALVIVILIIPIFAVNAFAVQLIPGVRWCHMSEIYNGTEYTNSCILTVSTSYLSGNWTSAYSNDSTQTIAQRALYIWMNHSDGLVKTAQASFDNADIDLITYGGTQAQWENMVQDVDTAAFVVLYDKESNQYSNGIIPGDVDLEDFGNRIDSARVYFAPVHYGTDSSGVSSNLNLVKNVVHELGHCINLGHPEDNGVYNVLAVMNSEYDKKWSDYPNPTYVDLDAIRSMYTQIYS